jgi:hypothetical protein
VFLPVVARPAAVAASGAPFAETLAVVGVDWQRAHPRQPPILHVLPVLLSVPMLVLPVLLLALPVLLAVPGGMLDGYPLPLRFCLLSGLLLLGRGRGNGEGARNLLCSKNRFEGGGEEGAHAKKKSSSGRERGRLRVE